jgi:16S rRNA processing protein RimM
MADPSPRPDPGAPAARDLVCLGAIVGPHGVGGAVRVRSFTAVPSDLVRYGALSDAAGGRRLVLHLTGESRGLLIARVEGVTDRDGAASLRGLRLHVARAALPEPEPESFYHVDLIGLAAVDRAGAEIGRVAAVHDLPAGDVLEIARHDGGELLLPFTRAVVPAVEPRAGRIVIDPPCEVEA